jgi:hypothetical protein
MVPGFVYLALNLDSTRMYAESICLRHFWMLLATSFR